jgi:hypothetical protein
MSGCPPGKIINPQTHRCVKETGRVGKALLTAAAIPERRSTSRRRQSVGFVTAFGGIASNTRRARTTRKFYNGCDPGYERNPKTGRCIKIGGRIYRRQLAPEVVATAPSLFAATPGEAPVPPPPAKSNRRRELTEGPVDLPLGTAAVAPLDAPPAVHHWIASNCTNTTDPLTGIPFAEASPATLQEIIRLHDNTCAIASSMHAKVTAEHKAGKVATLPDDPTSHMTLDDFRALRDAMRRKDPAYKLPSRRHQPPPPEWQLYISQDNRSGDEFASVMFVDVTKAFETSKGIVYPVSSVMIDMGFIPVTLHGAHALCAPQLMVTIIKRLADDNRLLTPVAGGWVPIAGFPFTKQYWATDRAAKFSKLCRDLTHALTTPM